MNGNTTNPTGGPRQPTFQLSRESPSSSTSNASAQASASTPDLPPADLEWRFSSDEVNRFIEERLELALLWTAHRNGRARLPEPISYCADLSVEIHRQLMEHGYARHPFVPGDEDRGDESLPVSVIINYETSDNGGPVPIVIFPRSFKTYVKECSVCFKKLENPHFWLAYVSSVNSERLWQILSFPTATLLPNCHHDLDVCLDCIETHIIAQVINHGAVAANGIVCPSEGCGHRFTHDEIRRLASPMIFALYDRNSLTHALRAMPDFTWCSRDGCGSGGFYDEPGDLATCRDVLHFVVCRDCHALTCSRCEMSWHPGRTCTEQNDVKNEEWIAANTKRCPNPHCQVPILKNGGCNHMTCSRCHYEFSWECQCPWDFDLDDPRHIANCGRLGPDHLAHWPPEGK